VYGKPRRVRDCTIQNTGGESFPHDGEFSGSFTLPAALTFVLESVSTRLSTVTTSNGTGGLKCASG
jgi:hypothetical protein